METKEPTEEQKREITKVLSKGRMALFGIAAKYGLVLFSANLIALLIEANFLLDVDPEQQVYFQTTAMIINFIFAAYYLHGQLKKNTDIVSNKIKEILSK